MNSSVFLFIYLFLDSCKNSATDAMSKLKPKCIMTKCLTTATATTQDINAVLRVRMKEIVCKLRWHSNNIIFISENVILTDEVYRSPQGYFVQLGLQ